MLRSVLAVTAYALATCLASAQAPPSPPPPPATPSTTEPTPPAVLRPTPPPRTGGPGAWIRIKAPNGAEIAVRCAEGEPTRGCADIVSGLAEKLMGAAERRRMPEREMMSRGPDGDMDRDERDRFRGEERRRNYE